MASTASKSASTRGMNTVSAGSGPLASMPPARMRAMAGAIVVSSSFPRKPPPPGGALQDGGRLTQQVLGDGSAHGLQRQVRRSERDAQQPAGQQHHRTRGV